MNVVTLEQTRPLVQFLALAAGLCMVGLGAMFTGGMLRLQYYGQIAWRTSLHRLSWLVSGITIAIFVVVGAVYFVQNTPGKTLDLSEFIFPIAFAIQGAMIFSTREEPPLEVLLSAPRPYYWLPLERLLLTFVVQGGVAVLGTLVTASLAQKDIAMAVLRWLCPSMFLGGVAIYVTVISHEISLGTVFVVLLCFGMAMGGKALMPADMSGVIWASPLHWVQPYIWPLHSSLKPTDLALADYMLNRVILAGTGMVLIALAVNHLRDTERQLLSLK